MELGLRMGDVEGTTVVTLSGDLDLATAPKLRDALVKLATSGERCAVVDLSAVEFIDSTGLGVLVGCLKRFRSLDGDLRVVITTDRIARVFEMTGLDKAFSVHDAVEVAVAP